MRQYFLSQRNATGHSAGARQARFAPLRAELTLQDNQITEGWKKGDSSSSPSAAEDRRLWSMKPKLRFTPSSSSGYVTAAREIIRVLQEADRYQRSSNICISLKFNPNTRATLKCNVEAQLCKQPGEDQYSCRSNTGPSNYWPKKWFTDWRQRKNMLFWISYEFHIICSQYPESKRSDCAAGAPCV